MVPGAAPQPGAAEVDDRLFARFVELDHVLSWAGAPVGGAGGRGGAERWEAVRCADGDRSVVSRPP